MQQAGGTMSRSGEASWGSGGWHVSYVLETGF